MRFGLAFSTSASAIRQARPSASTRFTMSTAAGGSKASQTSWQQPKSEQAPTLRVYNSLTRTKVPFISRQPNLVTWYNCGPTVYDDSHMGHARNYVTQDILRKLLRDYFGYNVHFVMNITDIDDKVRASLLEQGPGSLLTTSRSSSEPDRASFSSNTNSSTQKSTTSCYRPCRAPGKPTSMPLWRPLSSLSSLKPLQPKSPLKIGKLCSVSYSKTMAPNSTFSSRPRPSSACT